MTQNNNQINPDAQSLQMAVMPSLTHGSLFSGIGGFDLAAEWMGWENKLHCELNDFGKRILKYYWPNAISYDDIKKTDFTIHRGTIDIISGGFPCQPYSSAGKRKGKEDERHLWPEMLRAIREIQPTWVVGENVRGLTNWNGGMVFDEVQADLENEGYEVTPFLLPASGVNAPHERYRIWFVAYSTSNRREWKRERIEIKKGLQQRSEPERKLERGSKGLCIQRNVTNAMHNGLQGSVYTGENNEKRRENENRHFKECLSFNGRGIQFENFPTQSPICNGNDGIPSELDGITVSKWKQESIKAGGNAIVPQVAFQIFKAVAMHDASLSEA